MEQQFAAASRFVIHVAAAVVGLDVSVEQEHLAIAHDAIRVSDARFAGPQRFHLGSLEDDPRLERLQEVIVEPRTLVPRDGNAFRIWSVLGLQSAYLR